MIAVSIFFFLLPPSVESAAPAPAPCAVQEDVAQKIAAAGTDVAKLLELAKSYQADNEDAAKQVFQRVLELDAKNEEAHKALRHHFYDGQWFESYAELSKYRRAETERMKEKGLARLGDEWVPLAELPYRKMGWVKDGEVWVHPAVAARAKDAQEKTAKGWKTQNDGVWVAPEEQAHWQEGQWKCGDQWLAKDAANAFHAELGKWWTLPGEHFVAYSTCGMDDVAWINWYADKAYSSLVKIYGIEPSEKPIFVVLKSLEQYNQFASGNQAAQFPPAEIDGLSSLHHAFFAEAFVDPTVTPPEYHGCGAAFWDVPNPQMKPWGQFAIRHAAGLSYGEWIDRSWAAVSDMMSGGAGGQPSTAPFWSEKKVPRWLHYGAASYVERFMKNEDDAEAPWGWRDWSIGELKKGGALDDLAKIFAFQLDLNQIDASTRLIHESGLVVSFILDGDCKSVSMAHQALKDCLRSGKGIPGAVTELQDAIVANQAALQKYAGF